MKNLRIIIMLLLFTSVTNICAMRRFAGISALLRPQPLARHSSTATPHSNLVSTLHMRSLSTAPRIPHPKWAQHTCYHKLNADPKSHEAYTMLQEQDAYTRQTLLRLATQDVQANPLIYIALLEAGAKINELDSERQSPLHLLAQQSEKHFDETTLIAIFDFIAPYNPDFELEDMHGNKPRDYAAKKYKHLFAAQEPITHPTIRYKHPSCGS
ncbi:MAG: hypothetical protein AB7F19_04280 [Candidatus Babeliales bacterium]